MGSLDGIFKNGGPAVPAGAADAGPTAALQEAGIAVVEEFLEDAGAAAEGGGELVDVVGFELFGGGECLVVSFDGPGEADELVAVIVEGAIGRIGDGNDFDEGVEGGQAAVNMIADGVVAEGNGVAARAGIKDVGDGGHTLLVDWRLVIGDW